MHYAGKSAQQYTAIRTIKKVYLVCAPCINKLASTQHVCEVRLVAHRATKPRSLLRSATLGDISPAHRATKPRSFLCSATLGDIAPAHSDGTQPTWSTQGRRIGHMMARRSEKHASTGGSLKVAGNVWPVPRPSTPCKASRTPAPADSSRPEASTEERRAIIVGLGGTGDRRQHRSTGLCIQRSSFPILFPSFPEQSVVTTGNGWGRCCELVPIPTTYQVSFLRRYAICKGWIPCAGIYRSDLEMTAPTCSRAPTAEK